MWTTIVASPPSEIPWNNHFAFLNGRLAQAFHVLTAGEKEDSAIEKNNMRMNTSQGRCQFSTSPSPHTHHFLPLPRSGHDETKKCISQTCSEHTMWIPFLGDLLIPVFNK
jgi:hypothetical protein